MKSISKLKVERRVQIGERSMMRSATMEAPFRVRNSAVPPTAGSCFQKAKTTLSRAYREETCSRGGCYASANMASARFFNSSGDTSSLCVENIQA